jgi:hypothetical protein
MSGLDGLERWSAMPPSWWRTRPAQASSGRSHFPGVRPLRSGWDKDAAGAWESSAEEPGQWEVVCRQCGDEDGPAADQPEAARQLRGPYGSKRRAGRAAVQHLERFADPAGYLQ